MKAFFTLLVITLVIPLSQAWAQALTGTIAAGQMHALAIHADGTLWATGDNSSGQLGTGNTTNQTSWVQVGNATTWVRVSAGAVHSLALQANGTLWAWGDNTYGQLGTISSTVFVATPTQVPGTYTQISAGNFHSLALQANGTLWAWGRNLYGQLGNSTNSGTNNANPTPTQIAGTYTQVVAGYGFNLALQTNGTLWAWGRNTYGQLGNAINNATDNANPTPTQVGTDIYIQMAAGQYHSLALRANGSLWTWGDNIYGQLGNSTNTGTDTANPTPTQVAGTYTQLAAGANHCLALQADGSAVAWGRNLYGQLGNGTNSGNGTQPNPIPLSVPGTYVQLATTSASCLGLRADGTLWAWGDNRSGQAGSGTTSTFANPTPIATGMALPTRSTTMGSNFGLAVRADGSLWAWGDNTYGQLGNGTTTSRNNAVRVGTDNDWVQVAAGTSHSLALKANGTLWAWGVNLFGQLGNSANSSTNNANPTPTQVAGIYTRIGAGNYHSLALQADGTLWAWGYNNYGQLGNGTLTGSTVANPTPTSITGSYTQVAAGIYHSLALRADGTLWTWGNNDRGQLGTTVGFQSAPVTSPTQATGTYVQIAVGGFHSLGLTASGALYAWGSNDNSQLSNAASTTPGTSVNTPILVTGTYSRVAAGNAHSLALRADGTLWAWGSNSNGQLGIGSTTTASTPTQEATQATTWTTLATGSAASFSLARTPSGLVFASTGQNSNGQLGDGTTTQATRFDRISPLNSLQPLPVQLVSFQAVRTGPATAGLSWATATEANSAGFSIERSDNGVSFRPIGFVRAAGNSNHLLTYSFQDNACTTAAYYRLAQVDVDGSVTYSPVEAVAANDGTTALLLVPNPANGPVQALGLPTGTTLAVYDALGRLVRPATTALDVAGLAAGVYVVRAQAPGQPLQTARLLVE